MTSRETTPIPLPQEICGLICQQKTLHRHDLHVLCAVSSAFRHEAERLLYVAVSLQGARAIKSWCISVARRPYLALRTRKLMLFMPPQLDFEAADLSRIMHALHLCVNLTELYVFLEEDSRRKGLPLKNGDAVQQWILEGHPFKLKLFVNNYFMPRTLVNFLKSQPTICTLALKCRGGAEVFDAALPRLRNLDCSSETLQEFSLPSWYPRDIERLQYELVESTDVEELSTFVAVAQFSDTLKSLSINRRSGRNGLDLAVLTACVGAQVPNLKYLRIMDYTTRLETFHVPFLPFPIRLKKIETLIFRPPTRASDESGEDSLLSAYVDMQTFSGIRRTAERIMADLPTLKRFVIIGQGLHDFYRNPETGAIDKHEDEEFDDEKCIFDEHGWLKVS